MLFNKEFTLFFLHLSTGTTGLAIKVIQQSYKPFPTIITPNVPFGFDPVIQSLLKSIIGIASLSYTYMSLGYLSGELISIVSY